LFSDAEVVLQKIAQDIDRAQTGVLMEFYIWNAGGNADAVIGSGDPCSQSRRVSCRDSRGRDRRSPSWWKGHAASSAGKGRRQSSNRRCPSESFRTLVGRTDLRLHRKIVIVDGNIGWTGSMNMVDPQFFKQDAGVGEWVDAMTRVEGSAVLPLAATVIADWILETDEPLDEVARSVGGQAGRSLSVTLTSR
jgi:cardiolipin synthase